MKLLPCLLSLLVHRHTQPRPRPFHYTDPDFERSVYLRTGYFAPDGNLYMGDTPIVNILPPVIREKAKRNKGKSKTYFLDFLETF